MRISAHELLLFLSIKVDSNFQNTVHNIAETLTNIGFEIENIEFEAKKYENFVVGFVEECERHPNSNKLSICKVHTGKEVLQVLCGAPNVRKGLKVVLAMQGAIVPKNGFVITKTKLAGYESQGMICSAYEMGSETDDGTIIELPQEAQTGTKYAEYIGENDAIFDIAITPNRGDALSYQGIARELSAKGFGYLPNYTQTENFANNFAINEDKDLANSVFFAEFSGFSSVPNVAEILQKCGIQATKLPIVNYLNYITELYGQPMHLYDAEKISGQICVRLSVDGEKLITISGQEISLKAGDVVIADSEKILSLAGIIGDARSAICNETKKFVLESCAFNRDKIFQTIRKYGIHTTASFRFERYIDNGRNEFCPQIFSASKFAQGIGTKFQKTFLRKSEITQTKIEFTPQQIQCILGFFIEESKIVEILEKLGFICKVENEKIIVTVPSWRYFDVSQVYDIAEEILRFVGIENCPKSYLQTTNPNSHNVLTKIKNFISQTHEEIISLPFVSKKSFELFGNIEDSVAILNPIDSEKPYLRSSLVSSALENIATCEKHSQFSSAIFEVAKVFYKTGESLCEHNEICIVNHGFVPLANPLYPERKYNIFNIKETILNILTNIFGLNSQSFVFEPLQHNSFHPYQAFNILLGKKPIAQIAQIHPLILEEFEIKMPVFIGTINIKNVPPVKPAKKGKYTPFILPTVKRQISILIEKTISCQDILKTINKISKQRFFANILEIFANEEMKVSGKHSILIELEIFQHQTLKSEEIEEIVVQVVNALSLTFNAKLRWHF